MLVVSWRVAEKLALQTQVDIYICTCICTRAEFPLRWGMERRENSVNKGKGLVIRSSQVIFQ